MPSRTRSNGGSQPADQPQPSTALTTMEQTRRDLIQAQLEQLGDNVDLPVVKLMAAGAGLWEFTDTRDTAREFVGVILNAHNSNVLWDKPFGSQLPEGEKPTPACTANDGRFGTPRPGFRHRGLPQNRGLAPNVTPPQVADGTEQIECATCPYNRWQSKPLVPETMRPGDTGKGKAVTNQKTVYVLVEGRQLPIRVTLPPTSLRDFDLYVQNLSNRGKPVQMVATRFIADHVQKGTVRYSIAKFVEAGDLPDEQFNIAITKRQQFWNVITPQAPNLANETATSAATRASEAAVESGDDQDEIPF